MKSKKRKPQNPFAGKFKIMRLYCNVHNQGWVLFKIYGHRSFIWEFSQTEERIFPSGILTYDGTLTERRKDCETVETEYTYYPTGKYLYIDRSDIAEDGFINICINDRYRVAKINETDYWLYDLEEVEKEPLDYRFKIKIRKLL